MTAPTHLDHCEDQMKFYLACAWWSFSKKEQNIFVTSGVSGLLPILVTEKIYEFNTQQQTFESPILSGRSGYRNRHVLALASTIKSSLQDLRAEYVGAHYFCENSSPVCMFSFFHNKMSGKKFNA